MSIITEFYNKFFNKDFSSHKKSFYLAAMSAIFMLIYILFIAIIMRHGILSVFMLFIGIVLSVVDVYFAFHTEKFTVCGILLIILVNFFELPFMYMIRGEFFSTTLLYFTFGVLVCAVAFENILMAITVVMSVVFFITNIIYMYYRGNVYIYSATSRSVFAFETATSMVFIGLLTGICIRMKIGFYNDENKKAEETKHHAENVSQSKNIFLSNMSHEIRTPMNAILGTSQLLLETDIDEMSRDKVVNILNGCNALLSTVGDLLDFSRLESGKISIDENEYDFQEFLADIVNMISIRVMDKGIEFLVSQDTSMPRHFIGDSKHLRQIFINVLNNAVKYTKEGTITLSIYVNRISDEEVMLEVHVKDTGIGIKPEYKDKIFRDFERIDTKENGLENVEGTGLGLSICNEILKLMGGEINFESTYQKGSEFVFRLPQRLVKDDMDLRESSELNNSGKTIKRALIYEKNEICDQYLRDSLEQCGIEADSAMGGVMFRSQFRSRHYSYVFVTRDNYKELEDFFKNNLKNTRLAVICDVNQTNVEGYPGSILVRPIYYSNLNAYLNGKDHSSLRKITFRGNMSMPDVRVMAVDDNLTNLQVISSILSKYDMQVFTATGGQECLYRLETQQVDIIFLDYMMPDMDGIDTLKNIRAMNAEWAKKVPIIALTANAVSGVREMLLENGFNDYISKPVEISKLERSFQTFLPEELIKVKKDD